jgi:hypothetical protein
LTFAAMRHLHCVTYTLPLMAGAARFWAVRNGFYFTGAGAELPVAWSALLMVQILLGDGPYAAICCRSILDGPNECSENKLARRMG